MSVPNLVLDIQIDFAGDNEIKASIIVIEWCPFLTVFIWVLYAYP